MSSSSMIAAGMTPKPSLSVNSILYCIAPDRIARSIEYLDAAARHALKADLVRSVSVAYGDCSPSPNLSPEFLENLKRNSPNISGIDYTFFDSNLGHSGGQNKLIECTTTELIFIMNPDVLVFPNAISELLRAGSRHGVGLVEARQIPVEHPKDYDPVTGETSWVSGACLVGETQLFKNSAVLITRVSFISATM